MLVHYCTQCEKISINRLARDDFEPTILEVFAESLNLSQALCALCEQAGIYLLTQADSKELHTQLFGANY